MQFMCLRLNLQCLSTSVLWWGAYGGFAFELQTLAKRVISLCCSASGCERNWSEFSAVSVSTLLFVQCSYAVTEICSKCLMTS
jgi:hypothetical protein